MAQRCSRGLVTQSVMFPGTFGVAAAKQWLRHYKLKAGKVDRRANTLRFRQMPPSKCVQGNYATKTVGKQGVKLVLCCPKAETKKSRK